MRLHSFCRAIVCTMLYWHASAANWMIDNSGYDYFGDTLVRPLRHEPEVNYADGASGVISEPLRSLARRSPLISFSGTRFTNHLFVRPLYLY
jgi:hypothetical protein